MSFVQIINSWNITNAYLDGTDAKIIVTRAAFQVSTGWIAESNETVTMALPGDAGDGLYYVVAVKSADGTLAAIAGTEWVYAGADITQAPASPVGYTALYACLTYAGMPSFDDQHITDLRIISVPADGVVGAPGNDTNVIFNSSGVLAGSDDFEWDDAGKVLTIGGVVRGATDLLIYGADGTVNNGYDCGTVGGNAKASSGGNGGSGGGAGGDGDGAGAGGGGAVYGGVGGATGAGGTGVVYGGAGGATSGNGGGAGIYGGTAPTDGDGGDVTVVGGSGGANGTGGDVSITGGPPAGSGAPGSVIIYAANATGGNTAGGMLNLWAGNGYGSGDGGQYNTAGGNGGATGDGGSSGIIGGNGGATSGNGGSGIVAGGSAATSGDGGDVVLQPGTGAGGGVDGVINLNGDTNVTGKLTVSVPTGYGEMYMYDNVTACAIDTTNVYHAIYNSFGNNDGTLAPLRDTTHWTYKAGVAYAISAFADYNAPTSTITEVTTSGVHALLAGEPITITGTTNYNGTYLVLAVTATTKFTITKTAGADDATGSARRPATLKCLVAGYYRASFNFSGICASANDVFKWELNKNITSLDNIVARSIWTSGTNNYRSVSANGLIALTAGQYVWASVKNYSGTGDLTFNSGNVVLHMLK